MGCFLLKNIFCPVELLVRKNEVVPASELARLSIFGDVLLKVEAWQIVMTPGHICPLEWDAH